MVNTIKKKNILVIKQSEIDFYKRNKELREVFTPKRCSIDFQT